jgi:DNA-binding transcriptional LysR family regulator
METRLKYVYEVYRAGSFTKAAQKLFISQPSLSAMVKKVEEELGGAIFDRTSSPLELTEEGAVYIEYIQQIMKNEESLEEKLSDIRNLNKGRIRVGGSNYVISSIIPEIMKHIFFQYPGVQIELVEEGSFALHKLLEKGELDLVIDSFEAENQTFSSYKLLEETILLAVPKEDPINQKWKKYQISRKHILQRDYSDVILPKEQTEILLQKPFVFLKAENNMHQHAIDTFRQYDIQPNVRLHLDQLLTSLQYTAAGLGCSFVTDTLFRYGNRENNVCLYAFHGTNIRRNMSIVHKRNKYVSSASRLFIQIAKEHFNTSPYLPDA